MAQEILSVVDDRTPLDLLLWRRFGREVPGLVDATFELNPGLAALGPLLPRGTQVVVDLPAPAPAQPVPPLIRLY